MGKKVCVCSCLCVLQRARCPDVWFTILCCRACGAYLFKSPMLTNTYKHITRIPTKVLPLLQSVDWEMSRGASFPLLTVCSDSGKPVVAHTLAGSSTWHSRAERQARGLGIESFLGVCNCKGIRHQIYRYRGEQHLLNKHYFHSEVSRDESHFSKTRSFKSSYSEQ